jgi:hypothetical protein
MSAQIPDELTPHYTVLVRLVADRDAEQVGARAETA